jgi:hypothetical protein
MNTQKTNNIFLTRAFIILGLLGSGQEIICDNLLEKNEKVENHTQFNGEFNSKDNEELICSIGKLYPIDRIDSIVDGPSTRIMITQSEIERRGFEGARITREELIDENIASQMADAFKITISNDEVIKFLRQFGFDEDKTKTLWTTWNYWNEAEFYKDIERMMRSQQMFSYQLESRMAITEDDIQSFYEAHPVYVQDAYQLETAFVHKLTNTKQNEQLKKNLEAYCAGTLKYPVKWDKAVWNKREEISDKLLFVCGLDNGDVRMLEDPDGFLLIKLVEKREARVVPLSERRKEVVMKLRQERHPIAITEIKNAMRNKYFVYLPQQSPEWHNSLTR